MSPKYEYENQEKSFTLDVNRIVPLKKMYCWLDIIRYWITGSYIITRAKWHQSEVTPVTLSLTNLRAPSGWKLRQSGKIQKLPALRSWLDAVRYRTLIDRESSPNVAKCSTRYLDVSSFLKRFFSNIISRFLILVEFFKYERDVLKFFLFFFCMPRHFQSIIHWIKIRKSHLPQTINGIQTFGTVLWPARSGNPRDVKYDSTERNLRRASWLVST